MKKKLSPTLTFNINNFETICDKLAKKDIDLRKIIHSYGYPPFWDRVASFETLVYIILEQQVSLSSARAAFLKLKEKLTDITPESLLQLSDDEMRACYFSRQKTIYARDLAGAILSKKLDLDSFLNLENEEIRTALTQVKGIGNWTVDVYLMMVMHRTNLFPLGDVALIRSIKENKELQPGITKEEIAEIANSWQPYQTIAAYLLWHAYLCKRKTAL
ncbi:MAG: DNA-3-methyladenine glycosylase 2 family protein [Ferruginibacter sp.]